MHFDRLKPCQPDVRNPRHEARIDSDRRSEAPGTHTQLIKDEEPMAATEPHVGHDDDNPEVAGGNIPPVEQLDAPPVDPEAVPRRYPERQRRRPDYD